MSDFGGGGSIKARKQHYCEWCSEPIVKGEIHYQFKGIWEGEWQNWRMHTECSDAHDRETEGGEIHEEAHERGRTCHETEMSRWNKAKEVAGLIKKAVDSKTLENDRQIENLGAEILDLVVDWMEEERERIEEMEWGTQKKAKQPAVKATTP